MLAHFSAHTSVLTPRGRCHNYISKYIYTYQHTHPRIEKCLGSLYWTAKEHSTRRYVHRAELGFLTPLRDETRPEAKFNAM